MRIEAALDRFLLQLAADGRSPHTSAQYARHVRLLTAWLERQGIDPVIEEVDDQLVARFLTSDDATKTADGRTKKVASTNSLRASLRGFFGYCHRAGLIPRDPTYLVRRARGGSPPPRGIRDGELQRLRDVLRAAVGAEADRDRVLFEVLVGTGVRLGSALALQVEDVDLEDGVLDVGNVKGGRPYRVSMGDELRAELRAFIGDRRSGPLFRAAHGGAMTSRHWQRRWRTWRDRADVSARVTPHSARHRFAMKTYGETRDVLGSVARSGTGRWRLEREVVGQARRVDPRRRGGVEPGHGDLRLGPHRTRDGMPASKGGNSPMITGGGTTPPRFWRSFTIVPRSSPEGRPWHTNPAAPCSRSRRRAGIRPTSSGDVEGTRRIDTQSTPEPRANERAGTSGMVRHLRAQAREVGALFLQVPKQRVDLEGPLLPVGDQAQSPVEVLNLLAHLEFLHRLLNVLAQSRDFGGVLESIDYFESALVQLETGEAKKVQKHQYSDAFDLLTRSDALAARGGTHDPLETAPIRPGSAAPPPRNQRLRVFSAPCQDESCRLPAGNGPFTAHLDQYTGRVLSAALSTVLEYFVRVRGLPAIF